MNAFVAGATGLTGREVARQLALRGVHVHAHVRPDSARVAEWRARFGGMNVAVDETPWHLDALTATMGRVAPAVVFALLGTTRARGKGPSSSAVPETYEAVDYGLSRMLLDAVIKAGIRPRFVYLSSVGVSETARGAYLQVRARFERELRESGVPYTIARPSFIVGPRDTERRRERVLASASDAVLSLLGALGAKRLRDRYSSMTGEELARGLVALALDPAAANDVFNAEELRLG